MKRIRRIGYFIIGALTVLCLLMSSTDLFLKEDVVKIKKISVYVAAEESSYVRDFKRGIYEIANEERVDINYILLSEGSPDDLFEQTEREFESGVQALVVFSEEPAALYSRMRKSGEKRNVVAANAFFDETNDIPDVSFDVREAAGEISDALKESGREKRKIILLTKAGISEKIGQTVKDVFLENGIEAVCEKAGEETVGKYEKEKVPPVFIGSWITETEWALEHIKNGIIYGVGYSDQILKGIREGTVEGIAAFSMYGIGIHAIRQAIAMIEKDNAEDIEVSCRMITRENMKEQEEFLIPIH